MTEEKIDMQKSPSLEKLEMEHRIEMDEKEKENTWRSCCYDCNKNAVMYFTQVSIIVGIMVFCIFKLITDNTCVAQQAYTGLLTLLIGILSPSPTFKK